MDYCLNCILFCYDKMRNCSYNMYKLFFWMFYLFKIAIVLLIIVIAYYILDELLRPEFIEGLGAFQLMTVGIGAQRSVRNQVLCTTALSYNEYTLGLMQENINEYAKERNNDAYTQDET